MAPLMFVDPPVFISYIIYSILHKFYYVIGVRSIIFLTNLLKVIKQSLSFYDIYLIKNSIDFLTNLMFSPYILPEISIKKIKSILFLCRIYSLFLTFISINIGNSCVL